MSNNDSMAPFYKRPLPLASGLLVVLLVVLAGGWYWGVSQQYVSTENAFLKGDLVQISPQVAAPIEAVLVEENTHVDKGDVLVRLDASDYKVALKQAKTRLASAKAQRQQARAQLSVGHSGVAQAQAKVAVAKARMATASGDLKRLEQVNERAVSRQKVANAKHRLEQAQAQLQAARQQVDSAKAKVEAAQAGIDVAKAAMTKAKAQIKQARLKLSYTRIRAPVSGQVAALGVQAGEYVRPGQALLTVVPPKVWIKANFKETQITHMRVGQPVDIEIDAYPERTFHGHVAGIQHGTGAEFALLPSQNATGNFIKIVQRVPVKIVFDQQPDIYAPAPGLSVVPTVQVLEHPPWPW